jgi:hypothetical protein
MVWISATDFEQWAERLDLQNTLPAVVRRAIHGSGVPIKEIDFPAGDSVIYPGLDGYLIATASTAFVPDGISAWEFGTSDDVRDKANSDYKKRTEKPQAFSRREATFVFVTPRRWAEKDRWCARKRAEGAWRDVKVIDADGLEQWLELARISHEA